MTWQVHIGGRYLFSEHMVLLLSGYGIPLWSWG